jgi:hypothetical protein
MAENEYIRKPRIPIVPENIPKQPWEIPLPTTTDKSKSVPLATERELHVKNINAN